MSVEKSRVASIDVFRGLTVASMVFVNDLASLRGLPAWAKHMPSLEDGMTVVDLVFPAFLFIAGLSLPVALGRRLDRDGMASTLRHILERTLGLLVVGLLMVNMHQHSGAYMPGTVWTLLVYAAIFVAWNEWPREGNWGRLRVPLRATGFIALVVLAAVYRGKVKDEIVWLRPQWWGIIGLIGWAYATAALLYVWLRRDLAAMVGCIGLLTVLGLARRGAPTFFATWLPGINPYLNVGEQIGGHGSITLAGVVASLALLGDGAERVHRRGWTWVLAFGAALIAAGFGLRPYTGGFSKDFATPAWCLLCAGLSTVLFVVVYAIVDGLGWRRWAVPIMPAAQHALLVYILPGIVLALFTFTGFSDTWYGASLNTWPSGILRSLGFTAAMLGLAALLVKGGLRLRL